MTENPSPAGIANLKPYDQARLLGTPGEEQVQNHAKTCQQKADSAGK
jgi:hypothetical protein